MSRSPRHDLLEIYAAALAAVEGAACVRRALATADHKGPIHLLAVGKAAASMTRGAFDALGARIAAALVVTRHGYGPGLEGLPVTLLEAGHPLPDAGSLAAGEALLRAIDAAPAGARLLFLLSGGASSLVEVLPEGIGLDDWRRANDWLLASGLPIDAINAVRRSLSCIKGGRLALRLGDRPAEALLISDVPGDDPALIGSGLLAAVAESPPLPELPGWLRELAALAPAAPRHDDPLLTRIDSRLVATLTEAKRGAASHAAALGHPVRLHEGFLHGDAEAMGRDLAAFLETASPGVHIWGGETTVRLPPAPGRGGRNQHLALAAALEIRHRDDLFLLAAGSDGSDGPTEDAGALVDGGSVARGEAHCRAAEFHLTEADAGTFLEAAGDLVSTGPTGTNVTDLVIALKVAGRG